MRLLRSGGFCFVLVDNNDDDLMLVSDDSDKERDMEDFPRGYKQMMLVLHSHETETGKSLLAEILLRIFHGRKQGLHSVLSFDSAKTLFSKGEPIVIGSLISSSLHPLKLNFR